MTINKAKESKLTQEGLKELFHYAPLTGIFTRLTRTSNRVNIGDIAGSIRTGSKNRLHNNKYLAIGIRSELYASHRLSFLYMTGAFPNDQTDHIDGNGLNNRWDNLREVNNIENSKNHRLNTNNTSGFCGVTWHSGAGKWAAQIIIDNKTKYLGIFEKKSDAILARQQANISHGFHINHGAPNPHYELLNT